VRRDRRRVIGARGQVIGEGCQEAEVSRALPD